MLASMYKKIYLYSSFQKECYKVLNKQDTTDIIKTHILHTESKVTLIFSLLFDICDYVFFQYLLSFSILPFYLPCYCIFSFLS